MKELFKLEDEVMISALHLLWIVPLSTFLGFIICAILTVHSNEEDAGGHFDDFD